MKKFTIYLIFAIAGIITLGIAGSALAFHDNGVARCSGCHTMHNSLDGAPVYTGPNESVRGFLMKGADASSTCLTCHAGYGQFTGTGAGYGSGGDFYWLTKDYSWSAHGHTSYSYGRSHGHNIVAVDHDLTEDLTLTTAPGGTYDATYLGCNSCHDPHGKQGNELLLYGAGDKDKGYPGGGYSFTNAAPVLLSPGRSTASSNAVSNSKHTAFGSGMSAWCGNCHGTIATGSKMHPLVTLNTTYAGNYNAYVSTGDKTGGAQATSYWELVPFETGQAAGDLLTTSIEGPIGGTASVMCLTCHRAHASAFPSSGRWDFSATYMVDESHPLATDTGVGADDVANKYYGMDAVWASEADPSPQRSLCNKCHQQD